MTALEYMEKQLAKNRQNLDRETARGATEKVLSDIRNKIGYYEEAVEALEDKCWKPLPEFPREGM